MLEPVRSDSGRCYHPTGHYGTVVLTDLQSLLDCQYKLGYPPQDQAPLGGAPALLRAHLQPPCAGSGRASLELSLICVLGQVLSRRAVLVLQSTPLPSQLALNKHCMLTCTRKRVQSSRFFLIVRSPFTLPPHRRHRVAVSLCRSRAYDSPVGACWLCGHRALRPRLADSLSTATPRKPKNKK